MHQTQLQFLGWEGPLEKGMAIFLPGEFQVCVKTSDFMLPKPQAKHHLAGGMEWGEGWGKTKEI